MIGKVRLKVCLKDEANDFLQKLVRPCRQPQGAFLRAVPLRNTDTPDGFPVIAFLAKRIDNRINFRQRHTVNGLVGRSLGHGSGIAVDFAIRDQVQLTIVELSIDTSDR